MKTAKKVLSIVLAAALILGTVLIATSAYDFTDDQVARFTLKAEVLDATGAAEVKDYGGEAAPNSSAPTVKQKANQKTDFAEYSAISFDDHEYADSSKPIEVKPGQIVWVTVGMQTEGGLYPTLWESVVSYTSMFLSITNNTNCMPVNSESTYIGTYSAKCSAANYWALMNAKTRTKFAAGSDHSYYNTFDVDYTAADGAMEADLDEDIYAIPFYVDPAATVGTTGKIYMPKTTGKSFYTYIAGFEDGDFTTDPFEICDKYLDLSGAVLNFKVVGDGADTTELDEQIEAFEALKEEDYTTDSWAAAEKAYDDAVAIKADEDATQDDVDAAAEALEDAITALVAATKLNYAAIDTAIAAVPADLSSYTTSTVTALNNAKTAAQNARANATTQAELDTAAANLTNATNALAAKADMTALNAALAAAAKADTTNWTDASKTALNNAVTAGQAIVAQAADYSDTAAVASATADINNALANAALKDADYKVVDDAIAAVPADLTPYTDESVAAVNNAVAAVVRGYKADKQAEVNNMATAITNAINGLVVKTYDPADYKDVDAAISAFNALDQSLYTAESVKAVKDAIAAVVRGYDERKQSDVNDMADAINEAIEALELLPNPSGMVVAVEYNQTAEIRKTYSVKVDSRAFKIRFVDEAGNTVTISRADHPEYVTSYKADGSVCEDMDKDLAYEIWTVAVTLQDGTYAVIARDYADGWESADEGYTLNVVSSTKDAVAKSISVDAETSKVGESLPVTVTTGKDVLKVQLLVNGKEYKVFDKSAATVDGDNLVFNGHVRLYDKGANTITAKIKTADGWTETTLSAEVECVK